MKGPKPSQLELEVPVIRNEGEWLREAEHLADIYAVREGLIESLRDDTRKRRKEIKARDREISNLARALREGRGNRKQVDLFPSEATRALHDVAAVAEGKPIPSEAHVFVAKAEGVDECHTCGSNASDPVHVPLKGAAAGNGKEPRSIETAARDLDPDEDDSPAKRQAVREHKRTKARGGAGARTRA